MTRARSKSGSDEPVRLVLCEGRVDVAFWTGLLCKGFGCRSELDPPKVRLIRRRPKDPDDRDGDPLDSYKHHFRISSDELVEVFSVGGKDNLMPVLDGQVRKAAVRGTTFPHVLVNYDPDDLGSATPGSRPPGWGPERLAQAFAEAGEIAAVEDGLVRRPNGRGTAELVAWRYDVFGPVRPGVPPQQTVERMACAALARTFPGRGDAVRRWLEDRPDPPDGHQHKSAALAFMAGWHPDDGNFYQNLWRDGEIGDSLEQLLTESGVWPTVERLLGAG